MQVLSCTRTARSVAESRLAPVPERAAGHRNGLAELRQRAGLCVGSGATPVHAHGGRCARCEVSSIWDAAPPPVSKGGLWFMVVDVLIFGHILAVCRRSHSFD